MISCIISLFSSRINEYMYIEVFWSLGRVWKASWPRVLRISLPRFWLCRYSHYYALRGHACSLGSWSSGKMSVWDQDYWTDVIACFWTGNGYLREKATESRVSCLIWLPCLTALSDCLVWLPCLTRGFAPVDLRLKLIVLAGGNRVNKIRTTTSNYFMLQTKKAVVPPCYLADRVLLTILPTFSWLQLACILLCGTAAHYVWHFRYSIPIFSTCIPGL